MTEAVVVTGVIIIATVVMVAAVVTGVIVIATVVMGAAVVTGVIITGTDVIAAAFAVVKLKTSVITGADGVTLVIDDKTFMASPGAALAVIIS